MTYFLCLGHTESFSYCLEVVQIPLTILLLSFSFFLLFHFVSIFFLFPIRYYKAGWLQFSIVKMSTFLFHFSFPSFLMITFFFSRFVPTHTMYCFQYWTTTYSSMQLNKPLIFHSINFFFPYTDDILIILHKFFFSCFTLTKVKKNKKLVWQKVTHFSLTSWLLH